MNNSGSENKTSDERQASRLYFLDSLRGLAAIYIFLYHMVKMPQPNMEIPRWAEFVKLGGMGITFFFLVSSFSLYFSRETHKEENLFEFYPYNETYRFHPQYFVRFSWKITTYGTRIL